MKSPLQHLWNIYLYKSIELLVVLVEVNKTVCFVCTLFAVSSLHLDHSLCLLPVLLTNILMGTRRIVMCAIVCALFFCIYADIPTNIQQQIQQPYVKNKISFSSIQWKCTLSAVRINNTQTVTKNLNDDIRILDIFLSTYVSSFAYSLTPFMGYFTYNLIISMQDIISPVVFK